MTIRISLLDEERELLRGIIRTRLIGNHSSAYLGLGFGMWGTHVPLQSFHNSCGAAALLAAAVSLNVKTLPAFQPEPHVFADAPVQQNQVSLRTQDAELLTKNTQTFQDPATKLTHEWNFLIGVPLMRTTSQNIGLHGVALPQTVLFASADSIFNPNHQDEIARWRLAETMLYYITSGFYLRDPLALEMGGDDKKRYFQVTQANLLHQLIIGTLNPISLPMHIISAARHINLKCLVIVDGFTGQALKSQYALIYRTTEEFCRANRQPFLSTQTRLTDEEKIIKARQQFSNETTAVQAEHIAFVRLTLILGTLHWVALCPRKNAQGQYMGHVICDSGKSSEQQKSWFINIMTQISDTTSIDLGLNIALYYPPHQYVVKAHDG